MNAESFDVAALLRMRHSPVRNYVIPGLTSWLIGEPSEAGTIRLFECSRDHQETICPHSHRFDFQCWVLTGRVTNRIWRQTYSHNEYADLYRSKLLTYDGSIGRYVEKEGDINRWVYEDHIFGEGRCYSMKAIEVHSIYFSRGARVLFFEGRKKSDTSLTLEPVVDGEVVPTFKVEPWMFRRDTPQSTKPE